MRSIREDRGRLSRPRRGGRKANSRQSDKYIFFESAYFEARHRGNAVQARQYLDQAPELPYSVERYTTLRCEAAVLLVEGRRDEAARVIAEAKAILRKAEVNGDVLAERDLALDLERQLQNALGSEANTIQA